MFLRKRHLVIALAICAALYAASLGTRRITAAQSDVPIAAEGSFQPDGQYPGEAFVHATGVRAWGSWSGSDENTGTLTIGPFPAPRILRFGVGGYPNNPGNHLRVELVGTEQQLPIAHGPVGERWRVCDFELPADWAGRPIRLIGTDDAKTLGGWFALTEPIRGGRGDGFNALIETLTTFALNGLLLGLVFFAALRWLTTRPTLPPHWIPLGAGAIVAACGYVTFWAYFANSLLGVVLSWAVLAAAAVFALRPSKPEVTTTSGQPEIATVLKLMATVGVFYLAVLHLFPSSHDFYALAANRFREALPTDNELPHGVAQRLFASELTRNPHDEWRSSDRPPLQSGWQLLMWPATKLLDLDRRSASGTSAVWLQLFWVAAAYGLLRTFAVARIRAAGWVAALALSGFFLQNTTFTWPKLSAGAFGCAAFVLMFLRPAGFTARATTTWAAAFAGLAWLSHGGVAFSFLPLLPVLAWRARREWRAWLPGVAILLVLVLPWLAYQKFYDPPANRLFKWHLAGQEAIDPRGTWQTIRESYAQIGWREAWANKTANLRTQVFGTWTSLADTSADGALERRTQEFFYTARTLAWWPLLVGLALILAGRRIFSPPKALGLFAGWLLLTIALWCLLMFKGYTAVIHQGSYAVMIGLFVVFAVLLDRAGRGWLVPITALQAMTLGSTWMIANATIHGPATGLPVVVLSGVVLGWFVVRAILFGEPPPALAATPAAIPDSAPAAGPLRAWWQNPSLNLGVLAALALLLALRKPHALHTPQLWAEDGSIFLMQADLHGTSALAMPYMGYLHTLPRLIAWVAPRVLDPAWWPAFYNGLSFVIWLAVLARLFTSRFNLPEKPWLALALIVVPHTGEVFFNVTNLQWLTAFVLIQQAIIAAPKTWGERIGDLAILGVVTLTGPFGIAFLPLFAWRWWCDRSRDNALAFVFVGLCAALQAWFVMRTGPRFEFQTEPLRLWPNLVVLARRLIVWPVLGRDLALGLSPAAVAGFGGTILVGLLGWVLRPHPQRRLRVQIVLAFALITLAGIYRTRPDTWAADNLDFGDRYFYIPRVLLGWLLIWEFNSQPRALANFARALCLVVVVVHARNYMLPAPQNYHWASHVEPIRRGVRADLPILPEGWTLEYHGRP